LKNAEFLTYRWVESNSGPPRKYFSLTEKGAAFYKELEATWNELANAVKAVTDIDAQNVINNNFNNP
jgi:PadR family transcriptional regulator PadR